MPSHVRRTPQAHFDAQSDNTQREIAAILDRFEPPAQVTVGFLDVPTSSRKLIVLEARHQEDAGPFTYRGHRYQRVQTTTSVMPKDRYESLLLERAHARRRWENQPVVDVRLKDLDNEEILRTRKDAIRQRRISAGTSTDIGDILGRLGLLIAPGHGKNMRHYMKAVDGAVGLTWRRKRA